MKTKESLNSDGQQFHQYIDGIVDHHCLNCLFFCFDAIDEIVDHHYFNFFLF
jgi:hypothetical protein